MKQQNYVQIVSTHVKNTILVLNPQKLFLLLFTIFILSACMPATTPEQLLFTPGAPVVVTQNTFTIEQFSLQYPDGWRIITGPSDAPQIVTFVSPDNCALILVALGSAEPITSPDCAAADFQTTRQEITLDSTLITIAGSAPSQEWETFERQFEQVTASVQAPA